MWNRSTGRRVRLRVRGAESPRAARRGLRGRLAHPSLLPAALPDRGEAAFHPPKPEGKLGDHRRQELPGRCWCVPYAAGAARSVWGTALHPRSIPLIDSTTLLGFRPLTGDSPECSSTAAILSSPPPPTSEAEGRAAAPRPEGPEFHLSLAQSCRVVVQVLHPAHVQSRGLWR